MPFIIDAKPPAIIRPVLRSEAHVGLQWGSVDGAARVQFERLHFPKDIHEASEAEFRAYLPRELRELPSWMMHKGILFFVPVLVGAAPLVKTTVNLTTTSTSNQTYTPVLLDWNNTDNSIECGSHGGDGGSGSMGGCDDTHSGGGAGSGGKGLKNNVTLTPGGSMTFHCEAHGQGTGTGQACWANGATLAASSAGICGGANGGNGDGGHPSGPCCCGCAGAGDGGPGAGASVVGAKGDTIVGGNSGSGTSGGSHPGGSIAGDGGGGGGVGNPGNAGGNAAVQLINNKSLP